MTTLQASLKKGSKGVFVLGDCLTRYPAWHRQYQHCMQRFKLQWRCDAWYGGNPHAWLLETQQLLAVTRSAIRREHKRMS